MTDTPITMEAITAAILAALAGHSDPEIRHLRELIAQWQISHAERHADDQRAVDKALESNDKRLDGMNEFRDTLRDQAATFVSRPVFDTKLDAMTLAHQKDWSNLVAQIEALGKRLETRQDEQNIRMEVRLADLLARLEKLDGAAIVQQRRISDQQSRLWLLAFFGILALAGILVLLKFIIV